MILNAFILSHDHSAVKAIKIIWSIKNINIIIPILSEVRNEIILMELINTLISV